MAKISKIKLPNNTTYDVYGENVQTINWTDYQNLPSDKKTNSDIAYFISDVPAAEQNKGIIKDVPNLPSAIASFDDGASLPMPSLKVGIEPQQDLHGYDNPWVGGAGKNKLQVTGTSQTINGVTFTVNSDGTINVNGTATADARFVIGEYILKAGSSVRLNGSPVDGSASTIALGYQGYGIVSTANSDRVCDRTSQSTDWDNDVYISVTSGYTANNLTFKPMIRLASETDSTFAPYSNICPISGWDECNVTRTGKNLYKAELNNYYLDVSTGQPVTQVGYEVSEYIPIQSGQSIYIPTSGTSRRWFYDKYKNPKTYLNNSDAQTYTAQEDGYIRLTLNKTISAYSTFQIEYGNQATSYEAYNGQTYTIDLDGTRYGGSLDVVNGVMTVDRAIADLGDLSQPWGYVSNGNRFTNGSLASLIKTPSTDGMAVEAITSQLKVLSVNDLKVSSNDALFAVGDSGTISVRYTSCGTDTTAIKTALTGVQLVYKLATPITYQLNPTSIKSLEGTNNLSADSGDVVEASFVANATSQLRINDEIIAGGNVAGGAVSAEFANNANYAKTADSAKTISGTVGIANGGTGATTAANARTNLGLGNAATKNTTDTYSSTGTNPTTGKAVAAALGTLDGTISGTAGSGKTLTAFSQTDGKVSATFGNINITKSQVSDFPSSLPASDTTSTYSSTGTAPVNGKAVASALGTLDGTVSGSAGTGKTLTAFSQTDGKVSATFGNISITKSQVSDLGTIGTAAAKAYTTSVTSGSADLVTSGAVYTAIANLPEPMIFKGTLGTGGTITSLPTASTSNEGFTYKVITAGTYASQAAKVGDLFISNGSAWVLVPSGDDTVTDTWRNIKVNGTEKLGTGISTGAVDFVNGTNTTVSYTASGNKVAINATDTKYTATTTSIGSASAGTAIAADDITAWSAGTVPTLGTAIPADDITAWTSNTPTSCAISGGVLTFTAGSAASLSYTAKSIPNVTSVGTAPSLSYTARSIPNISVTATTVATGITAQ